MGYKSRSSYSVNICFKDCDNRGKQCKECLKFSNYKNWGNNEKNNNNHNAPAISQKSV
jgi:hypothetical protein